MRWLISELHRRRVLRLAGMYVVGSWIVVQVAGEAFAVWGLPDEALRLLWLLLALGFPIALVLGWRYDLLDGRIVRASPHRDGSTRRPLQAIDLALLLGLAVVLAIAAAGLIREPEPGAGESSIASDTMPALGAGPPDPMAVAVLPFRDTTTDPRNRALVEGLHEDVVTQLARLSGLKVIANNSVRQLEPSMALGDIARLLDAGKLLQGTVQRAGEQLRVNVRLVDTATQQTLWAERFDRELTAGNVFAVQSTIAEQVATAMQATLLPVERVELAQPPTGSLEAYEAYLLGNQALHTRTVDAIKKSVAHFTSAIELDPSYALAYVRLADATLLLNNYGGLGVSEAVSRADRFLAQALSLEPELGAAHATAALSLTRQQRTAEARAAYERAIALDPNHAPASHWYGDLLLTQAAQPAAALPLLERARSLDPLSPVITATLGETYEALGRFEQAHALYRKALTFDPDYPGAYWLLGMLARFHDGRVDEAVRWHYEEQRRDPARAPTPIAYAYLDLGDDRRAEALFRRALATHPDAFWSIAGITDLYRFRGDAEQALDWARRLDRRFPGNNVSLVTLVTFGEHQLVVDSFRERFPGFSCERPQLDRSNVFQMINVSLAFERTGDALCAQNVLEAVLQTLADERIPRLGIRGYSLADVEALARLGQRELALERLSEAIEEGVIASWWAHGAALTHVEAIRDDPRFERLMETTRGELASQHEAVRRLEAQNDLALGQP